MEKLTTHSNVRKAHREIKDIGRKVAWSEELPNDEHHKIIGAKIKLFETNLDELWNSLSVNESEVESFIGEQRPDSAAETFKNFFEETTKTKKEIEDAEKTLFILKSILEIRNKTEDAEKLETSRANLQKIIENADHLHSQVINYGLRVGKNFPEMADRILAVLYG